VVTREDHTVLGKNRMVIELILLSGKKGTSGIKMFGSVMHRVNMKLGSRARNSLIIRNQLHKRL